jgi:hypothetical protein
MKFFGTCTSATSARRSSVWPAGASAASSGAAPAGPRRDRPQEPWGDGEFATAAYVCPATLLPCHARRHSRADSNSWPIFWRSDEVRHP